MCLSKSYDRPYPRRTGYKLLELKAGNLSTGSMYGMPITLSSSYTKDVRKKRIFFAGGEGSYQAGFHIFTRLRDARAIQKSYCPIHVLCKVRFREQVAYGVVYWWEHGRNTNTVVARECQIVKVLPDSEKRLEELSNVIEHALKRTSKQR